MYLSRIVMNPRNRRVRAELASVYELHRTIMQAFPQDLPAEERVLFRVDTDRHTGVPTLLVQSVQEPSWGHLVEAGGYLLETPAEKNPDLKQVNLSLNGGQLLAFRLRANPTVKRNGKRIPLFDDEQQQEWLERHAGAAGFQLMSVTAVPEGNQDTNKHSGASIMKMRHYAVRFDGLLQVTDPVACTDAVVAGIGPAKAFGFGLLSLAPAG